MRAHWRLIFTSVAAAALLFAAVATAGVRNGSHAGAQGQTQQLIVGNLLELTGVAAFLGPPFEKAGVVGQKAVTDAITKAKIPLAVKVIDADTQADAQAAVLAARSLVSKGAT